VASRRGFLDDTIDAIVRRRLGNGIAEKIASAASVGIWGAESNELEAAACLPPLARFDRLIRSPLLTALSSRSSGAQKNGPRIHKGLVSFSGGLGELANAMASELGDHLVCGLEVKSIERVGGAWRITGQSYDVSCSNIVLACGAKPIATLLSPFAQEVSEQVRAIPHTSLATINFGFRRQDVRHPLDGYGFLVPRRWQTSPLLGVLFCSAVFPHHAPAGHVLIRAFLGGTRHPGALGLDDPSLRAVALRVLDSVLGFRSEPCLTDIARWNQAIPRYTPGHSERINRIRLQMAQKPGLWLAGSFMSGISVNDCITQGVKVAGAISGNRGERP
jgi:oxygen-dependent protoporphyrinogen oxidase